MNPISLASGVLPEFGPIDTIEAAAAAGFDAVGLWIEPDKWSPALTGAARQTLAKTGLPVLDVEVIWIKPGSDMAEHKKCIDIGAELGAKNVLCVSSDPDLGRSADRLAALCRHAEGSGIRVALEFGLFTEVKTIGSALTVLDRVAHPLRALLVDPVHVDRSGATARDVADVTRSLLPYAQFCDAPATRPDPNDFDAIIIDAIDLRRQMGEGDLPLGDLWEALPKDVPLSIELRSKALRDAYPDPTQRAIATARATRAWLGVIST